MVSMKKNASPYTLVEDALAVVIAIVGTLCFAVKILMPPLIIIIIFFILVGGLPPDTLGE